MPSVNLLSRVSDIFFQIMIAIINMFLAVDSSAGDDYDNVTGINNITTEVQSNKKNQNTQRSFQGYNGGVAACGDSEQRPISTGTVTAFPKATIFLAVQC